MQFVVPEVVDERSGELQENIKGRSPSDRLIPELPAPLRDETFCVGGRVARETAKEGFLWEDFTISCLSDFKNFAGDTSIVYTGESVKSTSLPSWLPTRLIGAVAPLHPRYFRFAVEHFRTVRSFASVNAMPEVTESFLLDCSERQLSLRLTIESKKRLTSDAIASTPCVVASSKLLSRIFGWNFVDDLTARI
jgi:hypothetical protein